MGNKISSPLVEQAEQLREDKLKQIYIMELNCDCDWCGREYKKICALVLFFVNPCIHKIQKIFF
jgi:hypothetical protein